MLLPQLSLAVTRTVVVPTGNALPLGGLAITVGGLQPPLAVTVKNTVAPLALVALTVRFDEQFNTIGGYTGGCTITWKLQLVNVPQVSLAVTVTVVVPVGNVLPLGGLAMMFGGGLQPPVAVAVKNTAMPFEPVAVTVMLEEQLRLIGGLTTVTWNEQFVVVPQVSLAATNTVVVPTGKVLPLGGLARIFGGEQPPLAVTVKKTVAPPELVAATVMFEEQFSTIGGLVLMAGFTVTLAEAVLLSELLSVGMELWMVATLSQEPALVANTEMVRTEMAPGLPGAKFHWPLAEL